jgi:hypothetical protein
MNYWRASVAARSLVTSAAKPEHTKVPAPNPAAVPQSALVKALNEGSADSVIMYAPSNIPFFMAHIH